MRITGRELRRIINEEVRRIIRSSLLREGDESVSVKEQQEALRLVKSTDPNYNNRPFDENYSLDEFIFCSKEVVEFIDIVIKSSIVMGSNAVQLRQGIQDLITKGSQSIRASAVQNVLSEFKGKVNQDGLVRAVLAAIKTGKSYQGPSFKFIDEDLGVDALSTAWSASRTIPDLEEATKDTKNEFLRNINVIIIYDVILAVHDALQSATSATG